MRRAPPADVSGAFRMAGHMLGQRLLLRASDFSHPRTSSANAGRSHRSSRETRVPLSVHRPGLAEGSLSSRAPVGFRNPVSTQIGFLTDDELV
jgi:hypothetical protein